MTYHSKLRLACHWVALGLEIGASFFIFFEALRINAMLRILGKASFDGEPLKYQAWYYHSGVLGFALLLGGILISGAALLLEHYELASTLAGTSTSKQSPQTPTPPTI